MSLAGQLTAYLELTDAVRETRLKTGSAAQPALVDDGPGSVDRSHQAG